MIKTIKTALCGILVVSAMALNINVLLPMTASAADCATTKGTMNITNGAGCSQGTGVPTELFGTGGMFTTIANVALYIIGAVSVLMLIYGGIRYTISGGETASVTAAKNTILYAIVGIVVALLAYAIVNFVITSFAA